MRSALSSALSITHPTEEFVLFVHVLNLITRLSIIAMGVVITGFFPQSYAPIIPGITMPPYIFSDWNTMRVYEWNDEELPQVRMITDPENPAVVIFFGFIVFSLFSNDLFRCGLMMRHEWNSCDNQIDFWWYVMGFVSIPGVFTFTALSLGTHDVVTLLLIGFLTFTSSVAAAVKELLRSLVNTETTPFMKITAMWFLQMIHDLSLFVAMIVTLLPFMYNLVHAIEGISAFDFANAIVFELLFISIVITQYSYDVRCSILEQRWPSHRAVVLWGLPRQDNISGDKIYTAEAVFPRLKVADKKDAGEGVDDFADPFCVETSEELYDKIYFGCHKYHIETESEHRSRQMELSPIGSGSSTFHKYTDEVGQMSRQLIGLLVEWRRYYMINLFINCLLVLSMLNMSGFFTDLIV